MRGIGGESKACLLCRRVQATIKRSKGIYKTDHLKFTTSSSRQYHKESYSINATRPPTFRREPDKIVPWTSRKSVSVQYKYETCRDSALKSLFDSLQNSPLEKHLEKDDLQLPVVFDSFKHAVVIPNDTWESVQKQNLESIKQEFTDKGARALEQRLRYLFYAYATGLRLGNRETKGQKELADLRYPAEWFPETRALQRTIHVHVGPTNSGKTYHALKSLEKAKKGIYAGPLRLLAHEVYTRMNAAGRRCVLVTGDERKFSDETSADFDITSCTVEMVNLTGNVDVAVIDEIQMLGSADRGWAWTQALMGVKAKELHLCGEARTVPILQEICALLGEKPIIHEYERLSPLEMEKKSLNGDLRNLKKGDCVVSFSVVGIHALRKEIEAVTGKKVATVYGSLPPETRAQQARLFNDPDNDYDYLVASDAIGMGLNLSIKRIIFESSTKYDGQTRRTLDVADIKQIAGRAGRYKSAPTSTTPTNDVSASSALDQTSLYPSPPLNSRTNSKDQPNTGLVTTLEPIDLLPISTALSQSPPTILSAGIYPPDFILQRFAQSFPPGTPFSYILLRLADIARCHSRFHMCGLRDAVNIADVIESVEGLTWSERMIFSTAPVPTSSIRSSSSSSESQDDPSDVRNLLKELASAVVSQQNGALFEMQSMPLELLDENPHSHSSSPQLSPQNARGTGRNAIQSQYNADKFHLRRLEALHKNLVLYLWLSYRFAGVFNTRALALEVKARVEKRIERVLESMSLQKERRKGLISSSITKIEHVVNSKSGVVNVEPMTE